MAILLTVCGITAIVIGGWRSYAVARFALAPIVHGGDPTRTAVEAALPVHQRSRVRLFARRLVISLGWLSIAMYGMYLVAVGNSLP